MTEVNKSIGLRIKMKRIEKGILAKDLAETIKVTPTYLSMIELGKNMPSFGVLSNIATALDTTPSYLLSTDSND